MEEVKNEIIDWVSNQFDNSLDFLGVEAGIAQTDVIEEDFCYVARFENDSGKVFNAVIDTVGGAVISFGPDSEIEENGTIYIGQGKIETGLIK